MRPEPHITMRKFRQALSVFLLSSLLLTACGSTKPQDTQPSDSTGDTTPEVTTEADPLEQLPKADYEGATFTILAGAHYCANKYEAEQTGETLDDAVFKRNQFLEENYNIDLIYDIRNGHMAGMSEISTALRGSVMAGDMSFDLYAGSSAYAGNYIAEGFFINQLNRPEFNFDQPWYYANMNDYLTIDGRLYASAGAYGLNTLAEVGSVIFHKTLLEELQLEEPYQIVLDGKWTMDKMFEMGRKAYKDVNGNTKADIGDRFGVIDVDGTAIWKLPFALGGHITQNDEDGIPQMVGASDHTLRIMEKINELKTDTELYLNTTSTGSNADLIAEIRAGNALFTIYPIKLAEDPDMREAADFGLLPYPKLDEDQDAYYTMCWADIAGVPLVCKDAGMSCTVLEAMNCYSYYETVPAYYDIVLQRKLARDDASSAMIDLMMEGAVLDFGTIFYKEINTELLFMQGHTENYASWYAGVKESCEQKLSELIEKLTSLEE